MNGGGMNSGDMNVGGMNSALRNERNFSGGPGALPAPVLEAAQQAVVAVPEVGLSILGISHRSDWFAGIVAELEANIRTLLGLPQDFHVLLLQGGATQQFSMVPMSLLRGRRGFAEYLRTGYWSGKVLPEAELEGDVRVAWDGEPHGFRRLPTDAELRLSPEAAYLHFASNETVEGIQFHRTPGRDDVPRVCDMSSDFLSRPCEAGRYSLIYAHAQKNLGPAGVTVVLVRDAALKGVPEGLPGFLDYRNHVHTSSNYNTPPVFAIYVVLLATRWLLNDIGGLDNMARINRRKADTLYAALDSSDGYYRGRAHAGDRSMMNVVFNLSSEALERKFVAEAAQAGFSGLNGHRAIGGLRASLYNGLTAQAVDDLVEFMQGFRRVNAPA